MKKVLTYRVILTALAAVLATGNFIFAEPAPAKTFSDDFSKPALASEWVAGSGEWYVEAGSLKGKPSLAEKGLLDKVLWYKPVTLAAGFTVSASVRIDNGDGAHWAGVAFHIQDAKNYYALRIAAGENGGFYQVLKVVDGTPKALKFSELKCQADTPYTLTVQEKEAGVDHYTIKDGANVILDLDGVVSDSETPFSGGYAGFYIGDSYCTLGNFHLETTAGK